jgi:arylsulfatase A-like enzyme
MSNRRVAVGPNVVLVVLDTLGARAAGLGRARPPMPGLTRIAEGGTWFRHAVSNAPWTYPSHASMLTGLLPSEHGMDTSRQFVAWERDDPEFASLRSLMPPGPRRVPELAERWLPALFAAAGYDTACVSNNPWVSRLTGMGFGFQLIRDPGSVHPPAWKSVLRSWPRLRSAVRAGYYATRARYRRDDLGAEDAVRSVQSWSVRRGGDRPFFLLVNLVEAHAPYLTPLAPVAIRDGGVGLGRALRAMQLLESRAAIAFNLRGGGSGRSLAAAAVARAMQEQAARYLDRVVVRLHRMLGSDGHRETVWCVTSDHGESFGEHGALLHGFTLDEEALHVPLVLAGAGMQAGERDDTVDLRRVFATLLELAGVAVPAGTAPSLVVSERMDVVAERGRLDLPSWVPDSWPLVAARSGTMGAVYRGRWKLVATTVGSSLYDLNTDPGESVDRSAERPDLVAALAGALPTGPSPRAPAGPVAEEGLTPPEERELTDRLAALGYLE